MSSALHISNKTKKHRSRIVFTCTVFCTAILIGLIVRFYETPRSSYSTHLVDFGLKNVGKLVTQEGCYTSIQTLGDSRIILGVSIPFTERKYVYSLDGIVSAGIDFEKIKIQPDEASKTVTIELPLPEIFNVTPDEDSFTIYHNGDNPFNGLHLEETNEARKEMEAEICEKAIKYHILDHATENAKVLINAFLSQSIDLQDWTVNYEVTKEKGE